MSNKEANSNSTEENSEPKSSDINKIKDRYIRLKHSLNLKDEEINDLNYRIKELESENSSLIQTIKEQEEIINELSSSFSECHQLLNDITKVQKQTFSEIAEMQKSFYARTGNSEFGHMLQKQSAEKKEISKEKQSFWEINAKICKMNKKIDSNEMANKDYSKLKFQYNIIFQELIDLYNIEENERTFSSDLIKYSFLLLRFSSSAYQLLRVYLPFPSRQTIYKHVNPQLNQYLNALKNGKIDQINHPTIRRSLNSPYKFPIVLSIDAVCVTTTSKYLPKKTGNLYSFTIYIQPIISGDRCIPARLVEHPKGIGNKEIVKILLKTSDELQNNNFLVKFLSFDGDRCYNQIHKSFFKIYENLLKNHDLFGIIILLKDHFNIPNGDYLHIFKNQRSHFLRNKISLDKTGKITFSLNDLENALGKNNIYLKDKSLLGSMRDIYALQMFNISNIKKLLEKNDFKLVMALLPLSLIHLSMRSPTLPIRERVYSLCLSFWLIYFHFSIVKTRNKKIISERKSDKKFCSFFSQISLIRLMNSILSILIAIYLKFDPLCLDRLGTHCLEFFFGLIRGFSNGIDGWEKFYKTVCKTVIAQEFLDDLDISPVINNRANLAGVVINEFIEDDEEFSLIANEAYTKALNLFAELKIIESEEESNLEFNDLGKWLENIDIHYPDPEKCVNPVSGVKIIARLINSSNKKNAEEEEEEEEEEYGDNK